LTFLVAARRPAPGHGVAHRPVLALAQPVKSLYLRGTQERQTAERRSGRLATSKSQREAHIPFDLLFAFFFFAITR